MKFALYSVEEDTRLGARQLHGQIEKIGHGPRFTAVDSRGSRIAEHAWPDGDPATHEDVFKVLLPWIEQHLSGTVLSAAGHRIVHGGRDFADPVRVDAGTLAQLRALEPLAPLHQPHGLNAIEAITRLKPGLPQIACFDTAFHRQRPEMIRYYALPRALSDSGIERYGFHGLSYEYIAQTLPEIAPELAAGRIVVAHLGYGASLCAIKGGVGTDTSMGFTALDGVPMGTRCGAIDPGVVLYLQQSRGMSAGDIEDLLYYRSGLLGVSGISGDMRTLAESESGAAREAIAMFCFRIAREICAQAVSMGGLDGIVFTAGIGEHAPIVREGVCAHLGWLGVVLDTEANNRSAPGPAHLYGSRHIHCQSSRLAVLVVPTDEEVMIARHTLAAIAG